jgi:hypothetical protein
MHRSASFARARFTITKSDWPAIGEQFGVERLVAFEVGRPVVDHVAAGGEAVGQRPHQQPLGERALMRRDVLERLAPGNKICVMRGTAHLPFPRCLAHRVRAAWRAISCLRLAGICASRAAAANRLKATACGFFGRSTCCDIVGLLSLR